MRHFLIISAVLMLSACGLKGQLERPVSEPENEQSMVR